MRYCEYITYKKPERPARSHDRLVRFWSSHNSLGIQFALPAGLLRMGIFKRHNPTFFWFSHHWFHLPKGTWQYRVWRFAVSYKPNTQDHGHLPAKKGAE